MKAYRVTCAGVVIHDPRYNDPARVVANAVLSKSANAADSFTFTIYPNNIGYAEIAPFTELVNVYRDEELIFRGRILNVKKGWNNQLTCSCESIFAAFNDSVVRPYEYTGGVRNYLQALINDHNDQVDDANFNFTLRTVTVTDPNDTIVRANSNYPSTMQELQDKLVNLLGGYLVYEYDEGEGENYIDYLADSTVSSTQKITLNSNLLGFSQENKGEDIITCLIPLGAKDDNDERLTIRSVNSGLDYIENSAGIDLYGRIFGTMIWDDVTVAANLLSKAQAVLPGLAAGVKTIKLTAADLSQIDPEVDDFNLLDYVTVEDDAHMISGRYLVKSLKISLDHPESNTITLGSEVAGISKQNNKVLNEVTQSINNMMTPDRVRSIANNEADDVLVDFINGQYTDDLEALQEQIDGQIETYFDDYVPTLNNAPANSWTTTALKDAHLGDLFYVVDDPDHGGECYRFAKIDDVYQWQLVTDSEAARAIQIAQDAAELAGVKKRVFTTQPTPPYDVGDLWVNGQDLKYCQTARSSGSYNSSDWILATDYIDQVEAGNVATSTLSAFVNGDYATFVTNTNTSLSSKITTYYQNSAPTTHNTGDLWVDTGNGNQLYRWNGESWVSVRDAGIQNALTAASNAQTTADGKIVTYVQTSPPADSPAGTLGVGDLWFDSDNHNKLYRWNGSTWVVCSDLSPVYTWWDEVFDPYVEETQAKIDGKIETWYQSSDPSSSWSTSTIKAQHVGDIWYDTGSTSHGGKAYIYESSGSTYSWVLMTTDPPEDVFDMIDGKARVFVSQPTPPYEEGDLWTNGTDLYRCRTARSTGSFNSNDWILATAYITATAATNTATSIAEDISSRITGGQGGYVQIHINTNTGEPDEILIMNTDDITTASRVWRWNQNGLGYSSSGYAGPYTTAWAIADGGLNADFITNGILQGIQVIANSGSIGGWSIDSTGISTTITQASNQNNKYRVTLHSPSTSSPSTSEVFTFESSTNGGTSYSTNLKIIGDGIMTLFSNSSTEQRFTVQSKTASTDYATLWQSGLSTQQKVGSSTYALGAEATAGFSQRMDTANQSVYLQYNRLRFLDTSTTPNVQTGGMSNTDWGVGHSQEVISGNTWDIMTIGKVKICRTKITKTVTVNNVWQNIYSGQSGTNPPANFPSVTYPYAFASVPYVYVSLETEGSQDGWLSTNVDNSPTGNTKKSASPAYDICRGTAGTPTVTVDYLVIGEVS